MGKLYVKRYELTAENGEVMVFYRPTEALSYKNMFKGTVKKKVEEVNYDCSEEDAKKHLLSMGCQLCGKYEYIGGYKYKYPYKFEPNFYTTKYKKVILKSLSTGETIEKTVPYKALSIKIVPIGKVMQVVSDDWYKKADQYKLSSPVSMKGNVMLGRGISRANVEKQYGWNSDFNGWDYTAQQAWHSGGTSLIANKKNSSATSGDTGIVDRDTYQKIERISAKSGLNESMGDCITRKYNDQSRYYNRVAELRASGLSVRSAKKQAKLDIYKK